MWAPFPTFPTACVWQKGANQCTCYGSAPAQGTCKRYSTPIGLSNWDGTLWSAKSMAEQKPAQAETDEQVSRDRETGNMSCSIYCSAALLKGSAN